MSDEMNNKKLFLGPPSELKVESRNFVRKKQSVLNNNENGAELCSVNDSEDDFFPNKSKNFTCLVCSEAFSSKLRMNRHAKSKHPNYIGSESKICKKFSCTECKKKFFSKFTLMRHFSKFHPQKISALISVKDKKFKCDMCKSEFAYKRNLISHKRKKHHTETSSNTVKCSKCMSDFVREAINNHFESCHGIKVHTAHLKFDSLENFMQWKSKTEMDTNSKFSIYSNTQGCTKLYFKCHLSGNYKSKGAGIRSWPRSKKLYSYCPALMKVTKSKKGECTVFFQSTHVGHGDDLDHSFPTNDKREIPTNTRDTHESADIDSNFVESADIDYDSVESAGIDPNLEESADVDPDLDDSDTHDSECDFLFKYFAQSSTQIDSLEERRNNLLFTYTNLIKSLSSPDQLDVMERNITFLVPTLDAVKRSDVSKSISHSSNNNK